MSAHADRVAALRQWWPWLIPVVALVVFLAPMVLTNSGFMPDWTNHLWLVDRQAANIDAGRPSLYLHTHRIGIFYPQFAFYGGTLYAITGALAWLLGDTMAAYLVSWATAFAAAYGGTTWLAMQCGLRGWRAQMPGLFLVTSAYFITNAYGRGAWPEFVAVAVIPLLVASGVRLLRGPWTALPLLAFIASAIVFAGSHNITLLYGATFIGGVAAAIAILAWRRPTPTELRRFAALAGVGVLCVGVNLWYLLPDIWYASRTRFGIVEEPFFFSYQRFLSALGVLFHPFRVMFPELKGQVVDRIYLQLPVFAFAWIAAALVLVRKRATRFQHRVTLALIIVAVPFAVLTATTEPWRWVPNIFQQVQFGYRLESYVLFAATGLLIVALCEIMRAPAMLARLLTIALGAIIAFGSALAVWQVFNPPEYLPDRDAALTGTRLPKSWYDGGVYRDNSPDTPIIRGFPDTLRGRVIFEVEDVRSDAITAVVDPPAGNENRRTNIAAGAYLLDIQGLEPVGRQESGLLVVRRPADRQTGPITVTISRPTGGPVGIGRIAAVVAAIALVGVLGWTTVRSVLRRRVNGPGGQPATRGEAFEAAPRGSTTPSPVPTVRE